MKFSDKMMQTLGLVLDDSKAVELSKIDKAIRLAPYSNPIYILFRDDLYMDYLDERRAKTIDVYHLRKKARKALNHAMASMNSQAMWDKAYRMAQTTASAEQALLSLRLDEIKVHIALVRCVITVVRALIIAWLMLPNANNESFKLSVGKFFLVSKLIKALSLCLLLVEPSSYDAIEAVLDAANRAGIRLNVDIGEQLADSNSLICQLINREDNAEKLATLEELENIQIPDEFFCPITFDVMTDPVGNIHSDHKFERTAILEWLKQQATNPSTRLPLIPDDLKRDFKLKREIDCFIENGCQGKTNLKLPTALVQQSVFQPMSECIDNNEISEQMMAESAFGRGSNTCQNRC